MRIASTKVVQRPTDTQDSRGAEITPPGAVLIYKIDDQFLCWLYYPYCASKVMPSRLMILTGSLETHRAFGWGGGVGREYFRVIIFE